MKNRSTRSSTATLALGATLSFTMSGCSPVTFAKIFGDGDQYAQSVEQTSDGAYVFAGASSPGGNDLAYLVKTDVAGNQQWEKTWTGEGYAVAAWVHQTADGGYVVAGETGATAADHHAYLAKTDASGELVWEKSFGGAGYHNALTAAATADGGFVLFGNGADSPVADVDPYLVKTSSEGDLEWERRFVAAGPQEGQSVFQTSDGGYILGLSNRAMLKTDASGNVEWQTPPTTEHGLHSPRPIPGGGYLVVGCIDVPAPSGPGQNDAAIARTDALGTLGAVTHYGGAKYDCAVVGQPTADGGYVVAGDTDSFGAGSRDISLVKTDPAGALEWQTTFGAALSDRTRDLRETSDGGYIVLGDSMRQTPGGTDRFVYLIKTDADGNVLGPVPITGG